MDCDMDCDVGCVMDCDMAAWASSDAGGMRNGFARAITSGIGRTGRWPFADGGMAG